MIWSRRDGLNLAPLPRAAPASVVYVVKRMPSGEASRCAVALATLDPLLRLARSARRSSSCGPSMTRAEQPMAPRSRRASW